MKADKAPIRHSGGDNTSSRWHGRLHDPWPRRCNHSWWQDTLWLGAEFHCLPLQRKGGCIGKGLPWSQADRAGYENPVEDCERPHQTVGVKWRFPVWLRPRQNLYRRNLCCQAAAREVSSCQQETLHGFHRPGEGIWSSTSEGHLVVWRSGLRDWCRGCMQMHGAMSVLVRGTVKSLKWRLVFTKDQYSARCSSSLCLKPYHESSTLGSPGRTSMPMTSLSSLNRLRNVSWGFWLGKKQWRKKDWQ